MRRELKINPQKLASRLSLFIKRKTKEAGFEKVILGLSGGVDSSTTLFLAAKALGETHVLVAILPYGKEGEKEAKEALLVTKKIKIPPGNIFKIDIKPIVDAFLRRLKKTDRVRKGNIIARTRMIVLFDLAKRHRALVCGTENKSEHLLGYYTRFGDEASDLEPLREIYKTQVKQLAAYLGVPKKIINKPPSAGLWRGQTDEKELGFSYQEADPVLFLRFEKKYCWEEIVNKGFKKKLIDAVKMVLERNEFKKKVPYLPKI